MTPLTPAEQAVVAANTGLAHKFGRKFAQAGFDDSAKDDAFQEAIFSLMRAAHGFDSSRGFKFSTYACATIIRNATRCRAMAHRKRIPSECDVYDYRPEDKREKPACGLELAELAAAMKSLDARARFVIEMRFMEGATLEDIGGGLGVSKERIRQIQNTAIVALREKLEGRRLAPKTKGGAK